jgi:2-dehydro-3-deoxyphosphogluconate aldolase/(4S)-4-hydroxy-2-oxoglutarate aldolase
MTIDDILIATRVIPVVTLDDPTDAEPLAAALVEGGIAIVEVTLRTAGALEAVRRIVATVPDCVVGVGTALTPDHIYDAKDAGASFAVSPGLTRDLAQAAVQCEMPFLPGVATPTEVMNAMQMGFHRLKFFPAEINGGVDAVKAMAPLFPNVTFCPTGGVNVNNAADYLRLPNVSCVGGSWVAPRHAIETGDWPRITGLARQAISLGDAAS